MKFAYRIVIGYTEPTIKPVGSRLFLADDFATAAEEASHDISAKEGITVISLELVARA